MHAEIPMRMRTGLFWVRADVAISISRLDGQKRVRVKVRPAMTQP